VYAPWRGVMPAPESLRVSARTGKWHRRDVCLIGQLGLANATADGRQPARKVRTMTTRVSIDPVTRIEGHLADRRGGDGGEVREAWASCTMWRGIETILLGRDPGEAWSLRSASAACARRCTAIASVRAVEDALRMEIPLNAQYIRNLILIATACTTTLCTSTTLGARLGGCHDDSKSRSGQGCNDGTEPLGVAGQLARDDGAVQQKVVGLVAAGNSASSPTDTGGTRR